MGYWQVGTDVLARSRFVVSPLAETVACLTVLAGCRPPAPGQHAWMSAHTGAFAARSDAFSDAFVRCALRPRWVADFIVAPPEGPDETIDEELDRVRHTLDADARAHIEAGLAGPLPDLLREPGLAERAADLLAWVWEHAVAPDWPRRRRVFEADIVARTQRLSSGGWAAVLDGLRPGLRWLGDGRLQINTNDNPPRNITDAALMFIPTTSRHGCVGWDEPGRRYSVIYPCAGWLAEPDRPAAPRFLVRLLGPVRADVLARLDTPKSTTHLVALTGNGLGSIGGHLKILLDAGLVHRRRSGRSVLYYRTPLGDNLTDVRDGASQATAETTSATARHKPSRRPTCATAGRRPSH